MRIKTLLLGSLAFALSQYPVVINANPRANLGVLQHQSSNGGLSPVITPAAPTLSSKAYILIDTDSGKIIAEKSSDKKVPPASLTKLMTLYVISDALKNEQIKLTDKVRVSKNAWKTGGSRMFIKEGQRVSVENLLKGIIVDSGNDACVAMAEYIAGSEKAFTDLMNQQARTLGLTHSHFTDSTGLPNKNHYSTAKDLAILSRALLKDFPQYYHWYKQKWFSFNGIKQPNRNRLLWRDSYVDGLKTGHTKEAGYCLVSSAKKDDMRLLAVVLGAKNEASRADNSQRLLNYGFRFFETHQLYKAKQRISQLTVYKGQKDHVDVGVNSDQAITIPNGQYKNLKIETEVPNTLIAPIEKGTQVGSLVVKLNDKTIAKQDLYALEAVKKGNVMRRLKDSTKLSFKSWFGSKD